MCPREFLPRASFATCCSQRCAMRKVKSDNAAKKAKERAELKARKDAAARIQDLHAAAQKSFNAWVRKRDEKLPCISCGAPPPDARDLHAGRDAGHFRSVGSAGHLRYTEDNVHGQCVYCNQFGAGRAVEYRIGLIERIGVARVEALETNNRIHKWTREELASIRDTYRAKLKALKQEEKA